MFRSNYSSLLKRKMSRKEFLGFTGAAVVSIIGIERGISELTSHAAGLGTGFEPESGTLAGGATAIGSTGASGGSALKFGSTQQPVSTRGPVRYPDLAAARTALGAPTDANYVTWDPAWTSAGLMLHEVFTAHMAANDILVLPERADAFGKPIPYLIDSSKGFMAAGVAAITGQLPNDSPSTRIPIVANSRCWFEMARGRRGIIGLGPNSVIEPSVSAFTRPPQIITNATTGDMKAYNAAGAVLQSIVGAQDALMRFDHASPFVANLTVRGRDFGGVAYSGINTPVALNLFMDAASRGHAGVPNGETGSLTAINGGLSQYENVEIKTTDASGASVVTSPIMWNRTTGGTMKNVKMGKPRAGMPTLWRCNGTYTWTDVFIEGNDVSLNLEEGGAAFVLNWTGGAVSTANLYHIIGESSGGSKKVTLTNVDVTGGKDASTHALACHFYSYTGTGVQKKADITRVAGADVPYTAVTYYSFMV